MRHLLELVVNAYHTNVILMSAPHRHDLMSNSCVNKEIEKFSTELHSRLERLRGVEMTSSQQQKLLHKTWATSEQTERKMWQKKKHHLSHRLFVKQANGANHWEMA